VWKELRLLDDIIQNTTVEYDGEMFSYKEICARWEGECFTNDILNLDYILPEVIETNHAIGGARFIRRFRLFTGGDGQLVAVMANHAESSELGRPRISRVFRWHKSDGRRLVDCKRAIASFGVFCDSRHEASRCQVSFIHLESLLDF
jgi:hypothetical protein